MMLNGTEHRGKVLRMSEDALSFVHTGETLEYTYKKAEIFKVVFSSGRQELFNAMQNGPDGSMGVKEVSVPEVPPNSVAILPFRFISNANPAPNEELARLIQDECYRIFTGTPGQYTYQDPMRTNAILAKHGISVNEVRDHLAEELCAILGVDKVVMGVVARNTKGSHTSFTSGGLTGVRPQGGGKTNIWDVHTGSSSTSMSYETSITMLVVDHTGARLFDKEHTSFWESSDAYKVTLNYLWKRSPLYGEK